MNIEPIISMNTETAIDGTRGFKAYLDRLARRRERRAAIRAYYTMNFVDVPLEHIEKYVSSQTILKRCPLKTHRRGNILMKRASIAEIGVREMEPWEHDDDDA